MQQNNLINMKSFTTLIFISFFLSVFAQSKKEQIEVLQQKSDSLTMVNNFLREELKNEKATMLQLSLSVEQLKQANKSCMDSVTVLKTTVGELTKYDGISGYYLKDLPSEYWCDEEEVLIQGRVEIYYLEDDKFAFIISRFGSFICDDQRHRIGADFSGIAERYIENKWKCVNQGQGVHYSIEFYFNENNIVVKAETFGIDPADIFGYMDMNGEYSREIEYYNNR